MIVVATRDDVSANFLASVCLGPLPQMVTHDATLGAAARGFGFDVRGI
jgi:hypothetical protein